MLIIQQQKTWTASYLIFCEGSILLRSEHRVNSLCQQWMLRLTSAYESSALISKRPEDQIPSATCFCRGQGFHIWCAGRRGTENERIRGADEFWRRGRSHLLLVEEGWISRAQAYKTVGRRGARGWVAWVTCHNRNTNTRFGYNLHCSKSHVAVAFIHSGLPSVNVTNNQEWRAWESHMFNFGHTVLLQSFWKYCCQVQILFFYHLHFFLKKLTSSLPAAMRWMFTQGEQQVMVWVISTHILWMWWWAWCRTRRARRVARRRGAGREPELGWSGPGPSRPPGHCCSAAGGTRDTVQQQRFKKNL